MRRAMALARRGQGRVEPNPMVGAVIARGPTIISEGFHQRFGTAHAEVMAIAHAPRALAGATLYVTLEPCCHWGKTPPCTDLIVRCGVGRVVAAMVDPFPAVAGKGIARLRAAGIRVDVGLLEAEARGLNAPFLTRLARQRPFVIAKWAQSLDGAIATAAGESRWISSAESRAVVHALRGRVDGILAGINTALADDPLLTARPRASLSGDRLHRLPGTFAPRRIATRIILDSTCRLPMASQLVESVSAAPVLVVHGQQLSSAAERRRRTLAARGVMTLAMPTDKTHRVALPALMKYLYEMDYTNVLLEGGAEILAAFFHADFVDEAHVFIAPILIGGPNARHALGGPDLPRLSQATRLELVHSRQRGPDVHLTLRATTND